MGLTVQDIMGKRLFQRLKLLAGESGVNREIRWFNIMEIMDSPESVAPNELLFTTGHGFQDFKLYQHLIPQLCQRNVSGIVIQTGYYIDNVPAFMLDQAEQLGFPVLSIPKNITFSEILHTMIQVLAPPMQQGWNNFQQVTHGFIETMLAEQIKPSLPQDSIRDSLQHDKHRIQVMLLEPVSNFGIDNGSQKEFLLQIATYVQSHSKLSGYKKLPQGKCVFLISDTIPKCRSMLYDLTIKFTLLSEQLGINYYMGAAVLHNARDIDVTINQAIYSIENLRNIRAKRGVCAYENRNFIRTVGQLHQTERSTMLENQWIQFLLDYDRAHATSYTHTLRIYLYNNCNITKTARQLYVHRQTLLKRLEKIEKIGRFDLDDYYTRNYMAITLMFHDYFVY